MINIGVLGAGTWGMALARMLSVDGCGVTVWSALPREVEDLAKTRVHPNLPGMTIPDEIVFTGDMAEVCRDKDLLLFAVPSVYVRDTARKAAPHIPQGQLIVDVAKGIEPGTLLTLTGVIEDELQKAGNITCRLVALSGPTHAEEVALDKPTAIVSACPDQGAAERVQDIFMNTCLRVYTNPDILGVELCGALKNIIALASGISIGLGFGDNAKAAIVTRGMVEIARLGRAMGCREETFYGLAGVGDLIVTATSVHSRNNRAGILMGQGVKPADVVVKVGMVVEGINALPAAMELSARYGVELPIISAVNAVVNHGADPAETVMNLMTREKKPERPGKEDRKEGETA
ncbi:MAG: NAD(P)-dependent glycerol-3-phosphate dehydrogenase [Clostridia bacterium]|nr:NAD(P)-dependent glycerol-3-phosphate dehydrogenase [Clostridia bacterium]